MKDMKFRLDIIWIGRDLKVVYIKNNAKPESYPEIFTPNIFAKYVIELNAGTAQNQKIKIGDNVILNIFNGQ